MIARRRPAEAPAHRRATLACALAAALLVAAASARASGDALVVDATGFRDDGGQAGCAIFSAAEGFPTQLQKAAMIRFVPVRGRAASCALEGLASGTYAVVVFHDANANRVIDKNFLGMPTEGIGVSRDARGKLGPPSFADAAFRYAGGAASVRVTLHYL